MLKLFKKSTNIGLILSVLLIAFSITLIVYPSISNLAIAYGIASILILNGLSIIIRSGSLTDMLSVGLAFIIPGIIIFFIPNIIISILPIVIGLYMIINSFIKLTLSLNMIKDDKKYLISRVLSILTLLCGFILVINPMKGADTITQIIGIIILVYSISNFSNLIIIKKNIKEGWDEKRIVWLYKICRFGIKW